MDTCPRRSSTHGRCAKEGLVRSPSPGLDENEWFHFVEEENRKGMNPSQFIDGISGAPSLASIALAAC